MTAFAPGIHPWSHLTPTDHLKVMQVTIKATKPVWSGRKHRHFRPQLFFYSLVKHTDLENYNVTLTDLMVYTFHSLNRTDDGHAPLRGCWTYILKLY